MTLVLLVVFFVAGVIFVVDYIETGSKLSLVGFFVMMPVVFIVGAVALRAITPGAGVF